MEKEAWIRFDSASGPALFYVTDLRHRAFRCEGKWSGGRLLTITQRIDEPVAVHFKVLVPGFGRVWLTADNEGAGYTGGTPVRPVVEELVRSQLERCHRREKDLHVTDRPCALDEGERLWDEAQCHHNPQVAWRALRAALVAGEDLEFLYAQHVLEKQGLHENAPIISTTFFGERLGEWSIGIGPDWPAEQDAPDFLRPREEWDLAARIVDGTTLPNFWRWIEPTRGHKRWCPIDEIVDFCRRRGIRMKSFALYWGGLGGTPVWFRDLSLPEKKEAIEDWVTSIVTRYQGQVSAWETVNEMHDWPLSNPFALTHSEALEMTRSVNELVGDVDPGTPRIINHCCPWGDYVQIGASPWGDFIDAGPWTPLSFLDEVLAANIPFEAVGVQVYNPGRDLMEVSLHLDRFAAYGKPLWVTEIGIPSRPGDLRGAEMSQTDRYDGWRGTWSEARQADWIEMFYTIAAGRSPIQALNYWDFDDVRAFILGAGLLNARGEPKPSFRRLDALCHRYQWGAVGSN